MSLSKVFSNVVCFMTSKSNSWHDFNGKRMVQIPNTIVDVIKAVRVRIENELDIKKMLLFGSYAKGNFSENSDIDLCIVAANVENEFLEALKIAPKIVDIDTRIEPIVVSEKEYYEQNVFGILKEIKLYGVEIV